MRAHERSLGHGIGSQEFVFEPPGGGAHFRLVETPPPPSQATSNVDAATAQAEAVGVSGATGDKGGATDTRTRMHRTDSVDYGFVAEGERTLILDGCELVMKKGDVVVELGNYHA
jgi:hypothetical protein